MKANTSYRWDWILAGLFSVLIYTLAARLYLTDWTPDLGIVEVLSLLGAVFGMVLGISRFTRMPLRLLVLGYSLIIIPWQLISMIPGESTTIGRLASLSGRFFLSVQAIYFGQEVKDTLFFVTIMSILFWAISLYSGFRLMRHPNILAILLPPTIPLLVIQYYDGYQLRRIWVLGFYFFIAILLIGRLNLLKNRERWKEKRVFAGNEPEFDLSRGLAVVAALVIMAAWIMPTPAAVVPAVAHAWQQINNPSGDMRQRLEDALAALSGHSSPVAGELYGKTLGLGQSAIQGEAEVFTVKPSRSNPIRHYWRVRVYDVYQEGRWITSGSDNVNFSPEANEPVDPGIDSQSPIEFVFNWRSNQTSVMVTPDYPAWTSRTGSVQVSPLDQEALDILSWSASPPILPGDQYRVQAPPLNPTIKDLRNAGTEYPEWVANRYLQLPENFSPAVRNLAGQVTAESATPYDKALAVTNYLRNEMEYSLTIPSPPPGVDPVDWFLFGWKSGFCNYYATAEVLMLRAAGVPARMVVGYAQGTHLADGYYTISSKEAHAWPEIYFPTIGWVEFEPTANQSALVRPSGEVTNETDDALPSLQERLARRDEGELPPDPGNSPSSGNTSFVSNLQALLRRLSWLWVIIFTVAMIGAGYAAWRLEQKHSFMQKMPRAVKSFYARYNLTLPSWLERWVRWSEVTAVERAFHAINQSLAWLGQPQPDHVTAAERAALLKSLVPVAADEIDVLTNAHEKTLYTPNPVEAEAATRVAWNIRFLTLRTALRKRLYGE